MSKFKLSKLKLIAVSLLVCVVALAAGGSIAYFSDSKATTDVFSVGSVSVSLTQSAIKEDAQGNMILDPEKPKIEGGELNSPTLSQNGKIFPGKTIYKDPTITNVGDDDAWVCAKVIIEDGSKDIHKLFGYEGYNEIDVEGLLSGGLLDETVTVGAWNGIEDVCYNDRYAMVQVADRVNDKFEFYFFILTELKNGDAVTVFEEIFFDPIFDHSQMLELSELKITVQAFAVQKFGFDSCYNAMRTAFGTYFEKCQ